MELGPDSPILSDFNGAPFYPQSADYVFLLRERSLADISRRHIGLLDGNRVRVFDPASDSDESGRPLSLVGLGELAFDSRLDRWRLRVRDVVAVTEISDPNHWALGMDWDQILALDRAAESAE
jgi:hypothetical protein